MRATILGEVSTLGETMRDLYEELITIHKAVVHLHDLQQHSRDFVKSNVQAAIVVVHEWTMRYKGAPLDFGKKMKPQAELEKARVRMLT